ncbi:MFS transporter [Geodermatophilus sp. CPCC 205506]|uniref:MFS transporter n=1 Tax=Geodermatophilus sp. CPCC 205506 TaxID=2936596 RepID=UPI003EECC61D
MSLNTVPLSVARVAGPVLGAFVLAAFGSVAVLWWAAAGHAVLALIVLVVRPPESPRRPRTAEGSVRAAWSYVVRRDRTLLRLLVAVTFVGLGSEPVFILAPSYADGFGGERCWSGSSAPASGSVPPSASSSRSCWTDASPTPAWRSWASR